jgi:hypothetical protein
MTVGRLVVHLNGRPGIEHRFQTGDEINRVTEEVAKTVRAAPPGTFEPGTPVPSRADIRTSTYAVVDQLCRRGIPENPAAQRIAGMLLCHFVLELKVPEEGGTVRDKLLTAFADQQFEEAVVTVHIQTSEQPGQFTCGVKAEAFGRVTRH